MDSNARAFFDRLLTTPGVSGYEENVQAVVRDYADSFSDQITTDLHGNVIMTVNPGADLRVMFAGHCDQLGIIVTHIDDNGFISFQTIGGWDPQQLVGQTMTLWTESGPVVGGVARKAIHLLEEAERKQVAEVKDLWVDIGAKNRDDAASLVQVGDTGTLQLGVRDLRNGLVMGPAMDDRAGVWVVVEALRRAAARGVTCCLSAVSTVQEEVGLRGARTATYAVDPHVGIAVDVGHATDTPGIDKKQRGDVSLGGGPILPRGPNVNPRVGSALRRVASEQSIPVQLTALHRAAGNDANAMQITRGGVAVGIVQIPNRYMHSPVETIAWSDLDHAADLLAAFACDAKAVEEFVP